MIFFVMVCTCVQMHRKIQFQYIFSGTLNTTQKTCRLWNVLHFPMLHCSHEWLIVNCSFYFCFQIVYAVKYWQLYLIFYSICLQFHIQDILHFISGSNLQQIFQIQFQSFVPKLTTQSDHISPTRENDETFTIYNFQSIIFLLKEQKLSELRVYQ